MIDETVAEHGKNIEDGLKEIAAAITQGQEKRAEAIAGASFRIERGLQALARAIERHGK